MLMVATIVLATSVQSTLLQHRVFLYKYLPFFLGAAALYGLPTQVFRYIVVPLFLCCWFGFHFYVGFVTAQSTVHALLVSGAMICVHYKQTSTLWQEFQATKVLQKERLALQTMQKSLQGMLSSIFDASCICDRYGRLLECSPHLQELLGDSSSREQLSDRGISQADLDLCSFAATSEESLRLKDFLANAAVSARNQAAKVQSSFRSARKGATFKACLYAIVWPGATSTEDDIGSPREDMLFVALQASDVCRPVLEDCSVDCTANEQPQIDDPAGNTLNSARQLRRGSISKSIERGASKGILSHASAPTCLMLPQQPTSSSHHYEDSESASILSFSYSDSQVPSSLHRFSSATVTAHPIASANDASVQTESRVAADAFTQTEQVVEVPIIQARLDTRSGKPPRPCLEVTRSHGSLKRLRRRTFQRSPHYSEPFLIGVGLTGTPVNTVEFLILETLRSINPLARGCCFWHAGLLYIHNVVQGMRFTQCKPKLEPHPGPQCHSCGCLQEDEEDAAQEDAECDTCGTRLWKCPAATPDVSRSGDASSDADASASGISDVASA
jgi:hypothetical protein